MRLAHLHIPHLTPFTHTSRLQQTLVSRLLTHKKLYDSPSSPPSTPAPAPPDPTILTFTPHPVYTTGRRDLPRTNTTKSNNLDPNLLPTSLQPIRHLLTRTSPSQLPLAEFHATLRGGQTTYHGPGQLVAYTILDLRRLRLGPRQHIRLLERSVLDVLSDYGVEGGVLSEQDPGVWVDQQSQLQDGRGGGSDQLAKKIAAVGVHLRRYVSSYGVGLNVTEEPMWFFRHIVACGLEGREPTSLVGCGVRFADARDGDDIMREVAERFVAAFVRRVNQVGTPGAVDGCCKTGGGVGIDEVYRIEEGDLLGDGGE
ncbi:lipoyl(octanoyl) transferase [Paracoccidioides brasiliensis Pb03]|nr:lipoyl(octanoyl) transferase [Paracoccidioides brasiliensis Pb03]